jgi:broad specificity phosphatase PhoE
VALTLYITHPEVVIDPDVPMPRWGLNATGRARATAFANRRPLPMGTRIFSSSEQKALDLAEILAAPIDGKISQSEAFGENDRSSTGFLAGEAFTEAVRQLFGAPEKSYRGWERASDAQRRIVAAVKMALAEVPPEAPVVFCGHGCVGTLLKCALAGRPIALSEDQRLMGAPGGGNVFAFDRAAFSLLSDWIAMESFRGLPPAPAADLTLRHP